MGPRRHRDSASHRAPRPDGPGGDVRERPGIAPVADLQIEAPSLEDAFLEQYR